MNPTSNLKKFLLPGLLVVLVIVGGLLIWKTKATSNQQAALFKTTTLQAACKINIGPNGLPIPGTPSIKVISPNGGETFTAGQQITVKWTSCSVPGIQSIRLMQKSIGGGFAQVAILTGTTANDGNEVVTIPSNVAANNNYAITVASVMVNNYQASDQSDNLFTINGPSQILFLSSSFIPENTSAPADGTIKLTFKITANGSDLSLREDASNTTYSLVGASATDDLITCSGVTATGGVLVVPDGGTKTCTLAVKFNTTTGFVQLSIASVAGVPATNIKTPFY